MVFATFRFLPSLWADRRIVLKQMLIIGNNSLPLVLLIGGFTGAIAALQATNLFAKFHLMGLARPYIGGSIATVVFTELAPVLTALVIAGRVGGAMAAEIGTMAVSEQLDALEMMAIDKHRFLVLPRVFAALTMIPLLTVFSNVVALLGAVTLIILKFQFPAPVFWGCLPYGVHDGRRCGRRRAVDGSCFYDHCLGHPDLRCFVRICVLKKRGRMGQRKQFSDEVALEEARRILRDEIAALQQLEQMVDMPLVQAAKMLARARQVITSGVGKSGIVAQKLAATLRSVGVAAHFLHPLEALHGDLGIVRSEDVALVISKSGTTAEILTLAQILRHRNMDFAANHPAGQLGRNTLLKVADVMHTGTELPLLPPTASFRQVLVELSAKRLGCVCIVDDRQHLLGIITDGDVKRILQKVSSLEAVKAAEVMTADPVTIHPEALLADSGSGG